MYPRSRHCVTQRYFQLMERFNHGAMPRVDWMERITGKEITEKIQNQVILLFFCFLFVFVILIMYY